MLNLHTVKHRCGPIHDPMEVSVYDQLRSGMGCTTNCIEAMHHSLGSSLPKSPKMDLWFDHVEKEDRKTTSLMAQVMKRKIEKEEKKGKLIERESNFTFKSRFCKQTKRINYFETEFSLRGIFGQSHAG